jgi:AraC-like DNA-binding protein
MGFSFPSHFTSVFSASFGRSPSKRTLPEYGPIWFYRTALPCAFFEIGNEVRIKKAFEIKGLLLFRMMVVADDVTDFRRSFFRRRPV